MTNEPNASEWRQAIDDMTIRQPIGRVSWACNPDQLLTHARELASTRTAPLDDLPHCAACDALCPYDNCPCPNCGAMLRIRHWVEARAAPSTTQGELLPCPFCGSKDVILRPEDNDTWGHIRCTKCNALGPAYSESGAINDAWNTRTAARESTIHPRNPTMPRFTKIAVGGEPLPDDATDYVALLDRTTNLMWPARDLTTGSGNTQFNHDDAAQFCTAFQLCGFTDWRQPTVEELFALTDHSRCNPAADPLLNMANDWYWSSTLAAWSPADVAWYVLFNFGYASFNLRLNTYRVRAVRVAP